MDGGVGNCRHMGEGDAKLAKNLRIVIFSGYHNT